MYLHRRANEDYEKINKLLFYILLQHQLTPRTVLHLIKSSEAATMEPVNDRLSLLPRAVSLNLDRISLAQCPARRMTSNVAGSLVGWVRCIST